MSTQKARKYSRARIRSRCAIPLCLAFALSATIPHCARGQAAAIAAVSSINLQGNNITFDSFNSQDPLHSDWQTNYTYRGSNYGYYPFSDPVGKRGANTVVATDGSITNAGDAAIYGYLDTAPGGTISIKASGSVGDTNWIGPNPASPLNHGIQWGHVAGDMNASFPDVSLPPYVWASVPTTSSNINGVTYTYVIGQSGTYKIAGTLTASVYVAASNVVLYLPGGINLSSFAALTVGANADLTLYSGGLISFSGSAVFSNATQSAMASSIYGLPSGIDTAGDNVGGCTSISLGGANNLVTTSVYAPQASLSLSGGGASAYHVIGAFCVHDIVVNGHFNFHYDEALSPHIPPRLFGQPTNCIVAAGSNATFAVSVLGSSLNYQWFFDQTNSISNTDRVLLLLTNVQPSDAGNYIVVVTNLYGSVTSAPANLAVYTNPTPIMTNVSSGSGNFCFGVSGISGLSYSVQASTNLIDWTPLQTNVSPFLFTDTNTAVFPQRFFRSVFIQ